jgi:phosphate transport system permease protein
MTRADNRTSATERTMASLTKDQSPDSGDAASGPRTGGTPPDETGRQLGTGGTRRLGDIVFKNLAVGSGMLVTAVIFLIAAFLVAQAVPSLLDNTANFFTYQGKWVTSGGELRFGIPRLLYTTIFVSVIALLIAMPIALGIAIFLTEYAPKRLVGPITYTVDLLAAVPSIVFGLWGILVLGPVLQPINVWLVGNLSWLFLFQEPEQSTNMDTGATVLTAGIVLSVMILPIITAVTREVFAQTPVGHREAALALGATKWEVVRVAVLPFGKSGYISGGMLGLGRALGETMALMLIISSAGPINVNLMESGETFASKIALNAAEFDSPAKTGAYISAGLTLFVLTFIVNAAARAVVSGKGN